MTKTAMVCAQQRWEYMSISRKTDSYLARELNGFGEEGWELVTINYARGAKEEMFWTAFLKRPAVGHVVQKVEEAAPARHDPAPTTQPVKAKKIEDPTTGTRGFDLEGDEFEIHEQEPEE